MTPDSQNSTMLSAEGGLEQIEQREATTPERPNFRITFIRPEASNLLLQRRKTELLFWQLKGNFVSEMAVWVKIPATNLDKLGLRSVKLKKRFLFQKFSSDFPTYAVACMFPQ